MKTKSILLLVGLLAVSGAGMATATAFLINNAAEEVITGVFEEALVLKFGTSKLSDVSNLSPSAAQYQTLELLAPEASNTVVNAGFKQGQLTISLSTITDSTAGTETSLAGLTVDIADTDFQDGEVTPLSTLSESNLTYTTTITSATTYYLRFQISREAYEGYLVDNNFGGTITAIYDKVPTMN